MAHTLTLDGDRRPLDDRARAALAGSIDDVACARADFLIVSSDETEEYVQCANAGAGLAAEWRSRAGSRWRQVRIVRRGGSRVRLPPMVEGYQGYEKREVLSADEFVQIVEAFLAGQPPGVAFEVVDVTEEYAQASGADRLEKPEP